MMALSEGVECPFTLPDYRKTQCVGKVATINEPADKQYKRSLAFFRHIQQGVIPSICLTELPAEEEAAFVNEWKRELKAHEAHKAALKQDATVGISPEDWITEKLFHLPKSATGDIETAFRNFINGGEKKDGKYNPLKAYNCSFLAHPSESSYRRFHTMIIKTPTELADFFEKDKYGQTNINDFYTEIYESAPNNLDNIMISIIHEKYAGNELTKVPTNNDKRPYIPYNESFYILANEKVIKKTAGDNYVKGSTIAERDIIKNIFEGDGVDDVHPWLLYLLIEKYSSFMKKAFDNNMNKSIKYLLAYCIVAHHVANKERQYINNPSIFSNSGTNTFQSPFTE
jgi:hypothetical protein